MHALGRLERLALLRAELDAAWMSEPFGHERAAEALSGMRKELEAMGMKKYRQRISSGLRLKKGIPNE